MITRKFLAVSVGAIVLSAGLVLMTNRAGAAPPTKSGSTATENWDGNLPSASRFTVLTAFANAAVRDDNTGLVWEQAPDTAPAATWDTATSSCVSKNVGYERLAAALGGGVGESD